MANINISEVHLLNVPLENDYKHTLYFNSKAKQYDYFYSKKLKSCTDFTYQRKDHIIRVPYHYDDLYQVNYVMYKNKDRWFYAFVTEIEYVNEGTSYLHIETDVIQTWLFDYTVKSSFVEREHVSVDTPGLHTVDEGLATGEYFCNQQIRDTRLDSLGIFVAVNDYADSKWDIKGNVYGGVYSGMGYDFFPYSDYGIEQLNKMLAEYDDDAKAEGINSIFMGPKDLVFDPELNDEEPGPLTLGSSWTPYTYHISTEKNTNLNGYEPRNKKLLCYPYNYLYVSNNNGGSAIYHYEKFNTETCEFEVEGCITPGFSIRMCPQYYNNLAINHDEGLNMGKYAICCWNSDTYTNWLTSNAANNFVGVAGGALSIAGGVALIATGGGALAGGGLIAGGVSSIASRLAADYQASKIPDQVKGNTNCGDVITGGKNNCYLFHKMSIKREYAKIIDGFFDMFGYKVNEVKVPNTHHRSRYWYTKTIDVNIDGKLPQTDLQKIKNCYDKGITFWRNADEIQNYSLSNEIANIV